MKRKSVFGQLIKSILIPLIVILATLSAFYIRYNYKTRTSFNKEKKDILIEELKKTIEFEDIAIASVEENLTNELEIFSNILVNKEFIRTKNIENINLEEIRKKYQVNHDIYIIDTTGEIINTTFKKDLGFNLFNINDEHKLFLKNILQGNKFVSEKLSLEVSTGKQKKYTYQPTSDKLYIIELGSYSPKANLLINSINNGMQKLANKVNLGIISVDLFISRENKKSFNSDRVIQTDHNYLFENAFINKSNYDTVIKVDNKLLRYDYIYFKRNETDLYSESLIRIVIDITNDRKLLIEELAIFTSILFFTILVLFILFYKRAKLLTTPISELEQQVKLIESGDLSIRASVTGNNEITSLSQHFNSMIQKLEASYKNLEEKVRERTAQLEKQQKAITSSIRYAKRIQTAVLPPDARIIKAIPNTFIYFKPKDIVSGDFYWMTEKENKVIVAAVDCTGHGVPGGFMSMLGIAFLNEIVNKTVLNKHVYKLQASDILNQLRDKVIEALNQTGKDNEAKDGMDMALCIIDFEKNTLQFSGAHNPLILIRNSDIIEIKGDKKSVSLDSRANLPFENHDVNFKNGDMIYMFSDGYQDQFGGEKDRKFSKKRFKDLLSTIAEEDISVQKTILDETLIGWLEKRKQIDDILVIGIRLDPQKQESKQDDDWSDKKILIVEDIEINYILLVEVLVDTGVTLIKAKDGLEGVEMCKKDKEIDLVLMDINLPKLNGFEATKRIKEFRPELPIIAQTAMEITELKEKSKDAGCNDYFTKPIQFDKFLKTVKKYLNK